jgi:hypothetical protein
MRTTSVPALVFTLGQLKSMHARLVPCFSCSEVIDQARLDLIESFLKHQLAPA